MKYNMSFTVEVVDDELKQLCTADMPCADFLRESVLTVLKSFPTKILLAVVQQVPEAPAVSDVMCPECGSKMVSRKGQFGVFWGCSKYPNCKGTRDAQGRSKAERDAAKEESRRGREWTVE
jgi:ribosomal protein L37AE/L43A